MRIGVIGTMDEVDPIDIKLILRNMEHDSPTQFWGVILSGGTKGVDTVAQEFAKEEKFPFILFKPQFMLDPSREMNTKDFWIRDKQIIDNSDVVVILGPKGDKRCNRCERHASRRNKVVERRYL